MNHFFDIGRIIAKMLIKEQPLRILEISGAGSRYGRLLKAIQASCGMHPGILASVKKFHEKV